MAEQTDTLVNPVLQKKIDGYRMDNFSVPQELTVTITLAEYRELVTTKTVCDSKVSEASQARWKVERERDDLKTSLSGVRETIEKVRNDYSALNSSHEELKKINEKYSGANAELVENNKQLGDKVVEACKERDEAIAQLEKLRSTIQAPVKKKSKK